MVSIEELTTTEKLVYKILLEYPITRNSDPMLYIKVVEAVNPAASDKPFEEVMANLKDLGLPCMETVRRTRQKMQEKHEEVWSDRQIKKYREHNRLVYEEYARS